MTVAFFHDGPLFRDDNGGIHYGVLNDDIIKRYLFFGDDLVAVTRIRNVQSNEDTLFKNNKFGVVEVPNLNSIKGLLFKTKKANEIIKTQVKKANFIIARTPSTIGEKAVGYAKKYNKPILIEVVGCPWDSLNSHSWKGRLLAPKAFFALRRTVKSAPFVLYVTNKFLESRYPTRGKWIGCSDVVLEGINHNVLIERQEKIEKRSRHIVLGTCGIIDVKYKGQEHVIKAISRLKNSGFEFEYQLVGPGNPERLRKKAKKRGVEERVKFLGALPHEKVFDWLDQVDIYIQPSDTEGLCRALLEAMSHGCPCIASDAGGNTELIESRYIFRRKKVDELAKLILNLASDKNNCKKESLRNYYFAQNYNTVNLDKKRKNFYTECLSQICR